MQDPWDQFPTDQLAAFAARIHIHAPSRLYKLIAATDNETSYLNIWQPGVLHPFGQLPDPDTGVSESYLGGLARERTLFVLVPLSLISARRAAWLEYLAREEMTHLGLPTDDPARVQIYCELAWQEILQNPNPRPHIVYEADAQARQVPAWLALLKYRRYLAIAAE
jgi:hypothetical protein